MNDINLFLSIKYDIQQYSVQRNNNNFFLFLSDSDFNEDFFQNPILHRKFDYYLLGP